MNHKNKLPQLAVILLILALMLPASSVYMAMGKKKHHTDPLEYNKLTKQVNVYMNEGMYNQAIYKANTYMVLNSDNYKAYNLLSSIYYAINNKYKAAEYSEKSLNLNSKQSCTMVNLAGLYKELGEYDKAIKIYRELQEEKPDSAMLYAGIGLCLVGKGKIQEGINNYQLGIALEPNNSDSYNNIAMAYSKMNESDRAIEYFKKAIELAPDSYKAYNNLSLEYYNIRDYVKSHEYLLKAVKIEPEAPELYNNLGFLYLGQGDYDYAETYFIKAVQLNPNYADAINNLGVIQENRGDLQKAKAYYERALLINPGYVEAKNNIEKVSAKLNLG